MHFCFIIKTTDQKLISIDYCYIFVQNLRESTCWMGLGTGRAQSKVSAHQLAHTCTCKCANRCKHQRADKQISHHLTTFSYSTQGISETGNNVGLCVCVCLCVQSGAITGRERGEATDMPNWWRNTNRSWSHKQFVDSSWLCSKMFSLLWSFASLSG